MLPLRLTEFGQMPEHQEQMLPLGDSLGPESLAPNCSNCSAVVVWPEPGVGRAVGLGVVLGVFIICGVLGNILVILSVVCHRHLRTTTHYFIVNLAVADLLVSSTVLPFSAALEIHGRWLFGRTFCDVWAAMDVLCCTASIMSLCVISVDRYVGVSYPLRYPTIMTEKRGLLTLLGLWALSITISVGPLFGWKEPAPEDEGVCKITEEPGYVIFSAVGSFYLPLVVILTMYCQVYVVARRETRGLREGQKTERSDNTSETVTLRIHRGNTTASEDDMRSGTHFALRLLKFSREKKAAKTLGIVVGCFILCWLPFFLVLPISSIFPAYRPSDTVFKVIFWLGYFNSCINPVIYPCSSQEFKKAFLSVLGGRCLRRKSRPTHPFYQGHASGQAQSHFLMLAPESRGASSHLSPASSVALSRTPSSRDDRDWLSVSRPSVAPGGGGGGAAGVGAGVSAGAKVAGVCSKSLLRTYCCVTTETPPPLPSPPSVSVAPARKGPPRSSLPIIKIHQMSLCENGDAV